MISGTSVPEGHEETDPDARSSSIFTSGGATWTRRVSDDEDLEVLPNDYDTAFEITEVIIRQWEHTVRYLNFRALSHV